MICSALHIYYTRLVREKIKICAGQCPSQRRPGIVVPEMVENSIPWRGRSIDDPGSVNNTIYQNAAHTSG